MVYEISILDDSLYAGKTKELDQLKAIPTISTNMCAFVAVTFSIKGGGESVVSFEHIYSTTDTWMLLL